MLQKVWARFICQPIDGMFHFLLVNIRNNRSRRVGFGKRRILCLNENVCAEQDETNHDSANGRTEKFSGKPKRASSAKKASP